MATSPPPTLENEPRTFILEGGGSLATSPFHPRKCATYTRSRGWLCSPATTTSHHPQNKHTRSFLRVVFICHHHYHVHHPRTQAHMLVFEGEYFFYVYNINKNIYLYGFALPPSFLQTQAPSILSFIRLSSKIPKPMLPLFLHACLYEFTSNPVLHIQYRNHIDILVVRVAADYRYIFKK